MGFAIFFFLAWLIIGTFFMIRKELSIVENTLIFLISLIVIINVSWISTEEMKMINLTKSSINYTAYIFNRSIILPLLLLVQLNILLKSKTFTKKVLIIFTSLMVMLGLSVLSTYFNLTNYIKWNLFYDGIYYLILQLIAYYSYRLFKKVNKNVVEYS
ncbi:hypothetical protein [Bacillus sp. 1NLA3E]|uniref:hypothetical protein n=1 Tax=Bacillus sp. 1NLA3E TaxID=666686 RepID=UPI000247EEBA|nr:hypothetical protein [Bacillus sp. 1NLA3E]AGK53672.1 hypothetical protein B1NLA3E_09570 [Bacillus sp. 1NLA3E]